MAVKGDQRFHVNAGLESYMNGRLVFGKDNFSGKGHTPSCILVA